MGRGAFPARSRYGYARYVATGSWVSDNWLATERPAVPVSGQYRGVVPAYRVPPAVMEIDDSLVYVADGRLGHCGTLVELDKPGGDRRIGEKAGQAAAHHQLLVRRDDFDVIFAMRV